MLRIFLWRAAFMIGAGALLGNALALGLLLLQETTDFVRLDPESYFLSVAPVRWVWLDFLRINAIVLAVCTACMILPALIVRGIRPVVSLRHE